MRRAGAEPQRARTEPSVRTAPHRAAPHRAAAVPAAALLAGGGECRCTSWNGAWYGSEINHEMIRVLDRSFLNKSAERYDQQITDFMSSTTVEKTQPGF